MRKRQVLSAVWLTIALAPGGGALAADDKADPAPTKDESTIALPTVDLKAIRFEILDYCEAIRDKEGPYGCYRRGVGQRPGLYASCDVALIRTVMGEDLQKTLTDRQRREWINHINSYQLRSTGEYCDTLGHSTLHANGMVIGALGVLGGKMKYPIKLFEAFDEPAEIEAWLDTKVDWRNQHGGSHAFWGGMHCFSMSKQCTDEWRDRVFDWLDANLDENTGWWRKGVEPSNRYQQVGGSVHIIPMYEHHGRHFPYPERVIDSVLKLQSDKGYFHEYTISYLDLDALYCLRLMGDYAPQYRKADIDRAVREYAACLMPTYEAAKAKIFKGHPHRILAVAGIFGLLQQLAPETFQDDVQWTGIFTDRDFYQTDKVEVLPEK